MPRASDLFPKKSEKPRIHKLWEVLGLSRPVDEPKPSEGPERDQWVTLHAQPEEPKPIPNSVVLFHLDQPQWHVGKLTAEASAFIRISLAKIFPRKPLFGGAGIIGTVAVPMIGSQDWQVTSAWLALIVVAVVGYIFDTWAENYKKIAKSDHPILSAVARVCTVFTLALFLVAITFTIRMVIIERSHSMPTTESSLHPAPLHRVVQPKRSHA